MRLLFYILLLVSNALSAFGQDMRSRVVKEGLFIPWEIIYAPDSHIWFTQKDGYVCTLDPVSGHLDTIYHEPQVAIRGEGGMLGMALHPTFDNEPYVYIAYNYETSGTYQLKVVRYLFSANTLTDSRVILDNVDASSIHNGCRLLVVNDKLFITTGDAANTGLSQNVNSLNGKVLRINLDGTIPSDNPIEGSPVWSWGHRNAQGLYYHNGLLYSSEHGPDKEDEFNIIQKGRNYGWPDVEGFCDLPDEITFCNENDVIEPLYAWTPTLAVSAIAYYDYPMFPQFNGAVLMTTLKGSQLLQLNLNGTGDSVLRAVTIPGLDYGRLRAIAVAPDGRIFVSTSNSNASGAGTREDKIIELYDSTSVSILSTVKEENQLTIYPNPTIDGNLYFHFEADNLKDKALRQYTIYNVAGQVQVEGVLEQSHVNVSSLFPGIYIVRITQGLEQAQHKWFVKQQ